MKLLANSADDPCYENISVNMADRKRGWRGWFHENDCGHPLQIPLFRPKRKEKRLESEEYWLYKRWRGLNK